MTLPVPSFAALATGNQNLSLFDTQFNAIAACVEIPCTATGSNNVVLTPQANTPAILAYSDFTPKFVWTQPLTSTGPVTIAVAGGLAALTAYKNNGLAALGSGDLTAGGVYTACTVAALNSGAGGWSVDVVPTGVAAAGAVQGQFKNLTISSAGGVNTVTIVLDAVVVYDGTSYSTVIAMNQSVSLSTSGANGLDTGTMAANTWYYIWVIQNTASGASAGLLSLSSTAPTMPTGYAKKARVGAVRTNGTASPNTLFLAFIQKGRKQQFVAVSGTAIPTLASGANGTANGSTFTPGAGGTIAWSIVAPATASSLRLLCTGQATAGVIVAPNVNYAGYNSTTPPPLMCVATASGTFFAEITLETTNIYYASSGAAGLVMCLGYEDNL